MSLVAGIDPSLTSTGIVILENGKKISEELVKSKPSGNSYLAETKRLIDILTRITAQGTELARRLKDIELVVLEGLAFGIQKTTAIMQLAAIHYGIRMSLEMEGKKVIIVAPQTLKKFVTSKGNSKKDEMMLETFKRWGVSFSNNDLCDAFGLGKIGEALIDPKILVGKPQKDVLELLREQLPND